jgi:predicted negative regulator of RcsB-dependent stress response
MASAARRKTSFEVDFTKVDAARNILQTKSLTETVDAALNEVIKLEQRQRLADLLFEPGALDLDDRSAMAGAWR